MGICFICWVLVVRLVMWWGWTVLVLICVNVTVGSMHLTLCVHTCPSRIVNIIITFGFKLQALQCEFSCRVVVFLWLVKYICSVLKTLQVTSCTSLEGLIPWVWLIAPCRFMVSLYNGENEMVLFTTKIKFPQENKHCIIYEFAKYCMAIHFGWNQILHICDWM